MSADANIAGRLAQRAQSHADRAAIVEASAFGTRRVTFGALAERVARIGTALRRQGVGPGDRVLLFVPMSVALYEHLLGCLHAGATAVFVDAWADRRRLDAAVRAAAPSAFIGSWKAQLLQVTSRAIRGIPQHFVAGGALSRGGGALTACAPAAADDAALMTFTTGSTGAPKAAVRSHGLLWAQHVALAAHLQLREDDIDLPTLPIFVLNNLALGVTSVLPDFDPRWPAEIVPKRVWRQIERERVTTTTGSPAFYDRLLTYGEAHRQPLPVRALFTGGAPVLPPLAARLRDGVQGRAHVVYGSTEAEPISGIECGELLRLGGSDGDAIGNATSDATSAGDGICVGRPVADITLRILRPHDGPIALGPEGIAAVEVAPGETGEIVVAGAHVLRGYLNDPEAERANKIPDGARVWHRTGDGGRLDGEGRLWLMGRVRERVRRGGRVWWSLAAEVRALRDPDVRHAAYLGVGDPALSQRAVLVVERDRRDTGDHEELARLVAPHPVDAVHVLPRIPRDPRHASKTDTETLRTLIGA